MEEKVEMIMIYDGYQRKFEGVYFDTKKDVEEHLKKSYPIKRYWVETRLVEYDEFERFANRNKIFYDANYISWSGKDSRLVNIDTEENALVIHGKYGLW